LSGRDPRAEADVLVRKAKDDAKAMRLLAPDAEISDEIVGFHAQQAIEKWLKAVAMGWETLARNFQRL
jgi:HEPN domain-containing protein